jgi:hypothetical protein
MGRAGESRLSAECPLKTIRGDLWSLVGPSGQRAERGGRAFCAHCVLQGVARPQQRQLREAAFAAVLPGPGRVSRTACGCSGV